MKALTVWHPWAWAIAAGHKTIENRGWQPTGKRRDPNERFALHAGLRYDPGANDQIRALGIEPPPREVLAFGAVIATFQIRGVVEASEDPWFFGPYGWLLADVLALPSPVQARGALGLWRLTEPTAASVRRAEQEARAA